MKRTWKTKINVQRAGPDPGELRQAPPFNHSLRIKREDREAAHRIFDSLIRTFTGYKREQKLLDLDILVANLMDRKGKPIHVSFHHSAWSESPYRRASFFTVTLIQKFNEIGWLKMKTGYETRETRIYITESFLMAMQLLVNTVVYDPVNLIELKNSEGKLIPYRDTQESFRVRRVLKQVNDFNGQFEWRYQDRVLRPFLVAVYKRDFSHGGRLYTRGYQHIQGLSESEREEITINGSPIRERDYSANHASLLYAQEGIQYEGDPYDLGFPGDGCRRLVKGAFIRMVNCRSERQLNKSLQRFWGSFTWEDWDEFEDVGLDDWQRVRDMIREKHPRIQHHFGSDIGLRLQNQDAKIALAVLREMVLKRGEPTVSVHDSFVVREEAEEELVKVMKREYSRLTKGYEIWVK